jgi:hypothetical protein
MFRSFIPFLLMLVFLTACTASEPEFSRQSCPLSEPVWAKPPEDSAVLDSPAEGYYFVNEDRSIWASASWAKAENEKLHRREEVGHKVGWFRPAGTALEITGQRLDAQAPPLEAVVPSGYPTRFQATGLIFPTGGCWEVRAKAAERELSFFIWIEP